MNPIMALRLNPLQPEADRVWKYDLAHQSSEMALVWTITSILLRLHLPQGQADQTPEMCVCPRRPCRESGYLSEISAARLWVPNIVWPQHWQKPQPLHENFCTHGPFERSTSSPRPPDLGAPDACTGQEDIIGPSYAKKQLYTRWRYLTYNLSDI